MQTVLRKSNENGKLRNSKEIRVRSILEGIRREDQKAMSEFFELYSDMIYSFPIRFYNFSEDEAGDFYLYVFEHLRNGKKLLSFKGESKFSTWFYSVLRNLTIDFLRSRKENIKTTSYLRIDANGELKNAIDEIPDKDANEFVFEENLFKQFEEALNKLKIAQRTLFKLTYIHFFHIEPDEITWIYEQSGFPKVKILEEIQQLKTLALEKVNQVKPFEYKLNVSFNNIIILEERLFHFFKENPKAPQEREKWNEHYQNSKLPAEVIEMIQKLNKKRKSHVKLLLKQKKSFLSIRVPCKRVSLLTGIKEGVLSVQLIRIIDKLIRTLSVK